MTEKEIEHKKHLNALHRLEVMKDVLFRDYRELREASGHLSHEDKLGAVEKLEEWLQYYYEVHPNWKPEKMVQLEKRQGLEKAKRYEDDIRKQAEKIRRVTNRREWIEVSIAGMVLVSIVAIHLYFTMR